MDMGVDAKDIQVCMWRVVQFSLKFFYSYVKKHPFLFGILLFLCLLNRFFPSIFTLLIHSSPLLVFIVVTLRKKLINDREKPKRIEGDAKKNDEKTSKKIILDRNENSSEQTRRVVRRNVKERAEEVNLPSNVEEKDMVFSTSSNDCLVDKTELVEENLKEIREVKVDSVIDRPESSSAASKRSKPENFDWLEEKSQKLNGSEGESEESSEDGDEEEAREDRNKAVQWTESDQKNLMDLGISEIERNRRLESLIAKRRARKLLSMQVRRTLMTMGNNDPFSQIATISIPRTNPFFLPNGSTQAQFSPTPGSAPSVLLPMHNPFDLPYEPQEEKPNLTEDAFQKEFLAANQKEYCRHESFRFGPFFRGELKQDQHETFRPDFFYKRRNPEIPEYSRFKYKSDREDTSKQIEIGSSQDNAEQGQPHQEEDKREIQTKQILEKYENGGSSSSSSSEVNGSNKDAIRKPLKFSIPEDIAADREDSGRTNESLFDSSPCAFDRTRMEERFFYPDKRVLHTPTHSIASDLQVEVSEISSPPLTVDGTISNSDVESPTYDADEDVEKETKYGSEEMWVASSHLSGVEENESRSREVHEISEQDIIQFGFSRIREKSGDHTTSDTNSSFSSSKTELPEGGIVHEKDSNPKVYDEVQPNGASNSSNALPPEAYTFPVLEKVEHFKDKMVAYPSHNIGSEKLEEQSYPAETSSRELNNRMVCTDDPRNSEAIKVIDSEGPTLINQEASENILATTNEDDSKSIEIVERKSEKRETSRLESIELSVEEAESIDDENTQDRDDEEEVVEVGCSSADLNSGDHVASDVGPEVVVEQGPSDSSCSSPESVSQEKVRMNRVSSPQLHKKRHSFGMEENDLLMGLSQENFDLSVSRNVLQSTDGSTAYPSRYGFNDKFQEVSKSPETYAADSNINSNVNDPQVSKNNHTENSKTIKDVEDSDRSKLYEETNSTYIVDIEDQSEELKNDQTRKTILEESYNPVEEISSLNSFEDFGGDSTEISESIQDRGHEQSIEEVDFSGVSQIVLPESAVEQIPIASSSSSSPTSVLQKKFSMDQSPSMNFDQYINIDIQQSQPEMVESNPSDDLPHENVALITQIIPPSSSTRIFEDLQGSCDPSRKSTEEANVTCNLDVIIPMNSTEEQEPSNPPLGGLVEETSSVSNFSVFGDTEGESERLTGLETVVKPSEDDEIENSRSAEQCEYITVTTTEAIVQLSKPAEEVDDPNSPTISVVREENSDRLPQLPIEEANTILAVNELDVGDSKEQPERLIRPEIVKKSSENAEVATSESVEDDSEGKSKKLTEVEAIVGSLEPT